MIFGSVMMALQQLMRRCPACGRKQVVPRSQARETINCKYCRAPLPPRPSRN